MRDIFNTWDTPDLRGHLVWIPMLPADNLQAAASQGAIFQGQRITQSWDGERVFGQQVAGALELNAPVAWDIYLLYASGARWADQDFPAPDFWMHQLNERADLRLEPNRLMAEVRKSLLLGSSG